MDKPFKVIHKYKNNNRRIQYHINIFIGDLVDDKIMKILNKIKELNLYQSLIKLSAPERKSITKAYGIFWYEHFFNRYHIRQTFLDVEKNNLQKDELIGIYGDVWYADHALTFNQRLQTVEYNYEYSVREERERKNIRKIIMQQREEVENNEEYTTTGRSSIDFSRPRGIAGDQTQPYEIINDNPDTTGWCQEGGNTQKGAGLPDAEEVTDDDLNYDLLPDENAPEIEYDDFELDNVDEIDPTLNLTAREIKQAISEEAYNKLQKKIVSFDQTKDDDMFDEALQNVYSKIYVTHQYIYEDDTISAIQKKICVGFKNNAKYGDNAFILPSYQYLWSEYVFKDKIEKIMLGYKWIVKNDILKIDIEPNTNLRIYEELRKPLSTLRDNIKRQGRIKAEDDIQLVLCDYKGFYSCNEIFMLDIYNEFGLGYSPSFEEIKNLSDVYLRVYFPRIRYEEIRNIISVLDADITMQKRDAETIRQRDVYETLNHEMLLEGDIMRDVEQTKSKQEEIDKYFHQNYVTQSVVRAYVIDHEIASNPLQFRSVDLYRIFDNFELNSDYPFIQYQPADGAPRIRYNERELIARERKETIAKWFENSPYGINFKVRYVRSASIPSTDEKYMTINLSDTGKINYKIVWKESDESVLDDITRTYDYIYRLINKINAENADNTLRLKVPLETDFKFAFISTIQKFDLPGRHTINHNDLSEFSRYFFPYIAMVIEPRKRRSKINTKDKQEKSKFGTYFRYKRIGKYENKTRIENRIFFFMRNYEYDDASLSSVISKEFNITEEQAYEEIKSVREKHPNVKRFRRSLKKFDNIPKYKPPGIEADIQGKKRDKYKLKISGARDKAQLDRITTFMKILIYLYIEIYIFKNKELQRMRDRLKRFTKVAKRLGMVDEVPDSEIMNKSVKKIVNIDKKRLGTSAQDDQTQWTRNCQNSGNDKKRQPQYHLSTDELEQLGYEWVEELDGIPFGHYQKKVTVGKGKKKETATLRAIQLEVDHPDFKYVYYTCDPDENGRHMYVGFLNKSKTQGNAAVPCCFIKDHLHSRNEEKRTYYLRSIGALQDDGQDDKNKISGDQLYILQDSNKIQEGRFGFLPKYMDMFFNGMLGHTRNIKNHYLVDTPTGYYFKYGSPQLTNRYLGAISSVFDLSIGELKEKMIYAMERDKSQMIFNSLNNGDIRIQFETIANYVQYITFNEFLDYQTVGDLLATPGILSKNGANIIVFQRKVRVIKKSLEKEQIKESYHLICQNSENIDDYIDPERPVVIIIKENRNYYPIIMVTKTEENTRQVIITKTFNYQNTPDNIVKHILEYYQTSCTSEYNTMIIHDAPKIFNTKTTVKTLRLLENQDYHPRIQVIDARYRCKYLVTKKNYIIPVLPSGTIYNLPLIFETDRYLKDFEETLTYLRELSELTKDYANPINCMPIGVFYLEKVGKKYTVSAILVANHGSVPIIKNIVNQSKISSEGLSLHDKPNDEIIDKDIMKGVKGQVLDERIKEVSKKRFETEAFELFRMHLAYFMNHTPTGGKLKTRLLTLMKNPKMEKNPSRKYLIKKLLYQSISGDLLKLYVEAVKKVNPKLLEGIKGGNESQEDAIRAEEDVPEEQGSPSIMASLPDFRTEVDTNEDTPTESSSDTTKINKWLRVYPDTKEIDYPSFTVDNNRKNCYIQTKDQCQEKLYCHWSGAAQSCELALRRETIIDFINKVAEEFEQNSYRAMEILEINDYFVSDIVDRNVFKERPGERIITYNNSNLKRILADIFGKDSVPVVAKRRNRLELNQNYDQLNAEHPLRTVGSWMVQEVVENNNTIYRAFANAYYWLVHPYNNDKMRNLGYYSVNQGTYADIYKSEVVDYLLKISPDESNEIIEYVRLKDIPRLIRTIADNFTNITSGLVDLYCLSKINEVIIKVYNDKYVLIYLFHPVDGFVYDYQRDGPIVDPEILNKYASYTKHIHLRFQYIYKNIYPDKVDAMYPALR
jgi:hypothetical protein